MKECRRSGSKTAWRLVSEIQVLIQQPAYSIFWTLPYWQIFHSISSEKFFRLFQFVVKKTSLAGVMTGRILALPGCKLFFISADITRI